MRNITNFAIKREDHLNDPTSINNYIDSIPSFSVLKQVFKFCNKTCSSNFLKDFHFTKISEFEVNFVLSSIKSNTYGFNEINIHMLS